MFSSLLKISDLTVLYQSKARSDLALNGASLDIPIGKYTLGVVGESGSGKTTLGLSILNLIEAPGRISRGKVEYLGRNVLEMHPKEIREYRWREISMVFQSAMNSLNPVKRVSSHLEEVLSKHTHNSRSQNREIALRLLEEVGIDPSRADAYPHTFSGGMKQRVVIAMALVLSPKVLIADEPTSALDVVTQQQILGLLKNEVQEKGLSMIFITHEIALLNGIVKNVAVMFAGEIVEIGSVEKILFEPLHPYTQMLIESLLTLDRASSELKRVPEAADTRLLPQQGCKYVNRCIYSFEKCHSVSPELLNVGSERKVRCHKYTS